MGIRQFKPVTPATRFRSVSDFEGVTKTTPEKSLVEPLRRTGGRNNKGHITTRHQGGGHKRQYRRIDFRREKFEQLQAFDPGAWRTEVIDQQELFIDIHDHLPPDQVAQLAGHDAGLQ